MEQSGAVEACWAHNPEVRGSKPRSGNLSNFMITLLRMVIFLMFELKLFIRKQKMSNIFNVKYESCELEIRTN